MVSNHPEGTESPRLGTLAAKLGYLFDKIRPVPQELGESDEPGRRYTNKEIADKINDAASGEPGGVTISAAYIGELRRGVASDPRTSHVQALAKAFGVDPGFFVDDQATRRIQEQIELLNELRRMDVQQVALRRVLQDSGLSEASTFLVEQMVARLQEVEGRATSGYGPDRERSGGVE
jgi:transcriptional regulator with XRE-family HTH domain